LDRYVRDREMFRRLATSPDFVGIYAQPEYRDWLVGLKYGPGR
jgi:hypothetical protein